MNNQTELFKVPEVATYKPGSPMQIEKDRHRMEEDRYTKEYCLKHLETAPYLWDMRAWLNHKDEAEVEAYVREPSHKNDGHSEFCVKHLKEKFKTPEDRIVKAIMSNPNIEYKNRLVACMRGETCPKFEKVGNYSECGCEKCE